MRKSTTGRNPAKHLGVHQLLRLYEKDARGHVSCRAADPRKESDAIEVESDATHHTSVMLVQSPISSGNSAAAPRSAPQVRDLPFFPFPLLFMTSQLPHLQTPRTRHHHPSARLPITPRHSLALRADGSLACFGYNAFGQAPPEGMQGPFTSIAAGGDYSLAQLQQGDDGTSELHGFGKEKCYHAYMLSAVDGPLADPFPHAHP